MLVWPNKTAREHITFPRPAMMGVLCSGLPFTIHIYLSYHSTMLDSQNENSIKKMYFTDLQLSFHVIAFKDLLCQFVHLNVLNNANAQCYVAASM